MPQVSSQSKKRSSASVSRAYQPTSLNLVVRKKETERIERENHAFAKRLFDKKPIVAKKNLDKDYMNHLKYRRQIQKMPGSSKQKPRAQTRAAVSGMSGTLLATDQHPLQPPQYLDGVQPITQLDGQTPEEVVQEQLAAAQEEMMGSSQAQEATEEE